jgi:hypothetical protein
MIFKILDTIEIVIFNCISRVHLLHLYFEIVKIFLGFF